MCFKKETFSGAKTWIKELNRQADPGIVIALVGNKVDLEDKRMVEFEVTVHKKCTCIFLRILAMY